MAGNVETNFVSMHTTNNDYSIEDTVSLSRLMTTVFKASCLEFFTFEFDARSLAHTRPPNTFVHPTDFGREKFDTKRKREREIKTKISRQQKY